MDFKNKYLKYKKKYLELKNQIGGDMCQDKKVKISHNLRYYLHLKFTKM